MIREVTISYLRMRTAKFRKEMQEKFATLPDEYSHLYMAIEKGACGRYLYRRSDP